MGMPRNRNLTSPREIARAERNAEIIRLRNGGMSQEQISKRVGVTQASVSAIIRRYMAELRAEGWYEAEGLIARENEGLDWQQQDLMRMLATEQNTACRVKMHEALLKVRIRRATMNGLDAAHKIEVALPADYDEVKRRYQQLIERRARELVEIESRTAIDVQASEIFETNTYCGNEIGICT